MTTSKRASLIFCAALYLSINSCSKPECKNSNPVFNTFSLDTKEYRIELAKQIRNIGAENLSYWFNGYLKKGAAEYIIVSIQGKDLCAAAEILVSDWGKVSGMRKEVSGYEGSELKGLDFEIVQDSTGTSFVFKDIDQIID
jgi:hypothetical protein